MHNLSVFIPKTQSQEHSKEEVIEFLTNVMRGFNPIHGSNDTLEYDFITGEMLPVPGELKMSDRLKASDQLVKIYGMAVTKVENTHNLSAKDSHFEELDSFIDMANDNVENAA